MSLRISVLADRPELVAGLWEMESPWPEFMRQDPWGDAYYSRVEEYADHVLVGEDDAGQVVAKAFSIPYLREGDVLPVDGWDGVIQAGLATRAERDRPDSVSAIEIAVAPGLQGTGLSAQMLAALRDNAGRHGFAELVAPVRPNGRTDPHEPMERYAARTRPDGLPVDPWLRVHVRAGGRIDSVAPRSMVIPGTLAEWRGWTGLAFDRSGPVIVPGALVPVQADVEHGTAVYVEPNVWVRHRTGR